MSCPVNAISDHEYRSANEATLFLNLSSLLQNKIKPMTSDDYDGENLKVKQSLEGFDARLSR